MKFSVLDNLLTFYIRFSIFIDGCKELQPFTFEYIAGNATSGTDSLQPVDINLPQERYDGIKQQGSPDFKTLSIQLKKHCTVWCYDNAIAPKNGDDTDSFGRVARLAQAKLIHLVFDYRSFKRDRKICLDRFVNPKIEMKGYKNGGHYDKFKPKNWMIFSAYLETETKTSEPS